MSGSNKQQQKSSKAERKGLRSDSTSDTTSITVMPSQYTDLTSTSVLVTQMESAIVDKINDLLQRLEEKIMAKFDSVVGTINDRILRCEDSLEKLRETNRSTQGHIEEIHRVQRLSDVIIRGVPYHADEKTNDITKDIASVIHHSLTSYVDSFRIKTKLNSKQNSMILMRFSGHAEQRAFLSAFRKSKGVKLSQLRGFTIDSPLFAHESLTPHNNALLREGLRHRNTKELHSVYSRNGFLYIKKSKEDSPMKITSSEQLHQPINSRKAAPSNVRGVEQ